jgi:MFS family permease
MDPVSTIEPAPALYHDTRPWYAGVTGYQWLVLILASAGWIFDIYEGQIFNVTRNQLLPEVLRVPPGHSSIKFWGDVLLVPFLLGGAVGGVLFGSLADRWGRRNSMILTILTYAIFSGLTYFAHELWQVALLRFLVAVGVGGEWAVAAALVAETFPPRARTHASGIFHASSVLGTWMAAWAGMLVGTHWRYAYLVGVVPAALVLIIRACLREPANRAEVAPDSSGIRPGSLRDLWVAPLYRRRAILGLLLAAIGLGGFWGVMVAGQNLAENLLVSTGTAPAVAAQKAKFAYGIVETAGGAIGLLSMGPICTRIGRRKAFMIFHAGALVITPIACFVPSTYQQLLLLLPIFGFFNLGIHAGYAIYFPELFPAPLRATGCGLCFNGGRLLAASVLILSGWMKALPGLDLRMAITLLSLIYLPGIILTFFLPETRVIPRNVERDRMPH